jgi:hypothetical protein
MDAIKVILCSMVGFLLAIGIIHILYPNLILQNTNTPITLTASTPNTSPPSKVVEVSNSTPNTQVYNELAPPKIDITIKNGSDNELGCYNYEKGKTQSFLMLNSKEERSYQNIREGEYIACSFKIDNRSTTTLHWFRLKSTGTYTLLFEQVECKTCQGRNYTFGTVLVTPDGQKELPIF